MNGDHPEDNLLIARANGFPEASAAVMTGLDGSAGRWTVTDANGEHPLEVSWPGGPIQERPEIRREVVVLYRQACEALGVPMRDEAKVFSQQLREATQTDHSESESATFMEDIMRGIGTRQDYIDLAAQHYFMYVALEEAAKQISADPRFADMHPDALVRLAAAEADLAYLIGPDWRSEIAPVAATAAYADRIREVAEEGWLAGIIAHHYTRYLGDLSGGQIIARRMAKQHDLDGDGVRFYDFTDLGAIPHFKELYRERLDQLGESLGHEERQRVLDEVRRAYSFNTEVFVDLGKQKAARVAA